MYIESCSPDYITLDNFIIHGSQSYATIIGCGYCVRLPQRKHRAEQEVAAAGGNGTCRLMQSDIAHRVV